MDTWTIRFTEDDGSTADLGLMPEEEAKGLLDGVRRNVDPGAVLVDLVAEVSARLPAGSRIRNTVRGWEGHVATDLARHAPFPGVRGDASISYVPTSRYTGVCVRWDHRQAVEWFDAEFIAPAA